MKDSKVERVRQHKGAITEGHCAACLLHDATTLPDYRRAWRPGGTYFFTVTSYNGMATIC